MRPARQSPALPGALPNALRRLLLAQGVGALVAPAASLAQAPTPGQLRFPRDHGSHTDTQTEWWYITGHTRAGQGGTVRDLGFQLTFFRARVDATQGMRSRFAARHLLFAHAAVADVQAQRFWHDQRIARAGFAVADASADDTTVRLHDWSLVRGNDGAYTARLPARGFAIDLRLVPTQPVLLQGEQGHSRKGPDPRHFSHYYSQPQLAFAGHITLQGQQIAVRGDGASSPTSSGAAWYDHEWSNGLMPDDAMGWDWIGMNLYDGSALMAFQMRDATGKAIWDAGSFRPAGSGGNNATTNTTFARGGTQWTARRHWTSPLTQARYPTHWQLHTPAGDYSVHALLDDQELDSRSSTGAVYWEGLSELRDPRGKPVGRGYLEMTGYAKKLVL